MARRGTPIHSVRAIFLLCPNLGNLTAKECDPCQKMSPAMEGAKTANIPPVRDAGNSVLYLAEILTAKPKKRKKRKEQKKQDGEEAEKTHFS